MSGKSKLFIIGASNFGREMESWLQLVPAGSRDWEINGFLHYFEGRNPLDGFPTGFGIIGDWRDYPLTKNDYCIIAVADCGWKERIYGHLKDKTRFLTYIAPDASVGKFNTIGEGCIICPGCIITTNIVLGNCVTLNIGTQIGHDCTVGDFSSIMPSVDLGGNVKVGRMVFIGTKATILPNMTIGNGATVGAGSTVLKKVGDGTTVFGNPAKKITS
jgi:sugar O-acyltransferase (sialic acid O-acetyltransferase NeuD family)